MNFGNFVNNRPLFPSVGAYMYGSATADGLSSGDAYVIADSRADGHQSTKSLSGMAEVITPAAAVGYEHKWKCEISDASRRGKEDRSRGHNERLVNPSVPGPLTS